MAGASSFAIVWSSPQSVYETSTTRHHQLGTKLIRQDGAIYYYGRHALSTTLGRGLLMTQAAVVANHQNRTTAGTAGLYTATSAINLNAAAINSYAGAIPSIGSLLG